MEVFMPLIKCPECHKDISDKAPQCPNCGCPASQWGGAPKEEAITCPKCGSTQITAHQPKWEVAQITCLKCGFSCIAGETEKYRKKFQAERDRTAMLDARIAEAKRRAANASPEEIESEQKRLGCLRVVVITGAVLFVALIIYLLINA